MPVRGAVLAMTALALQAACAGPPPPGSAACVPKPLAQLAVEFRGGIPTVVVGIDGQPAAMALDLGSPVTVIAEQAAERLNLARDPSRLLILSGVGGSMVRWAAMPRSLVLGGLRLERRRMEVAPFAANGIDGSLGRAVLLRYDTDWDLSHRRMTLHAPSGCIGPPTGWPAPSVGVPLGHGAPDADVAGRPSLTLPLHVDVKAITATLDTASSISVITPQAATRLEPPDRDADRRVRLSGMGPDRLAGTMHRFHAATIAGETLLGWEMAVAPVPAWAGSMILGVTFLRTRPAWLPAGGSGIWFGPRTVPDSDRDG